MEALDQPALALTTPAQVCWQGEENPLGLQNACKEHNTYKMHVKNIIPTKCNFKRMAANQTISDLYKSYEKNRWGSQMLSIFRLDIPTRITGKNIIQILLNLLHFVSNSSETVCHTQFHAFHFCRREVRERTDGSSCSMFISAILRSLNLKCQVDPGGWTSEYILLYSIHDNMVCGIL